VAGLLTTRELQELIKVDRSTIYRMAESGRIPAVKVGRQWRFPEAAVAEWLAGPAVASAAPGAGGITELVDPFPTDCIQPVADLTAEMLGVMIIITDIDGRPLTRPSRPCGLFSAIDAVPGAVPHCIAGWRDLATSLDLETELLPSPLGLLCARSFIRGGTDLRGMVIVGGIAPDDWPPDEDRIRQLASGLGMDPADFARHMDEVYVVDETQRQRILTMLPRIGRALSQITRDRGSLLDKLEAIAAVAGAPAPTQGAPR
jgi:excisionase family DNA binding protein